MHGCKVDVAALNAAAPHSVAIAEQAREAVLHFVAIGALVRPRRGCPQLAPLALEACAAWMLLPVAVVPTRRRAQDEAPVRVQRRADVRREVAAARVRAEAAGNTLAVVGAAVREGRRVEPLGAEAAQPAVAPGGGGGGGAEGETVLLVRKVAPDRLRASVARVVEDEGALVLRVRAAVGCRPDLDVELAHPAPGTC